VKIHFVRSGGFAGLRLEVDLDTGTMGREQAFEIERLVSEAGFFELPSREDAGPAGMDRFKYRVQVDSESLGAHTITTDEQAASERLQPLLFRLTVIALQHLYGLRDGRTSDEEPPAP
jgi:hypothetical protein